MKPTVKPAVSPTKRPVHGFSLIELVITIAILAITLVTIAQSLQFSTQFSADPLWQTKTVELVQAYADEILTKRYDEASPVGGTPPCTSCSLASAFGPDGAEFRGLLAGVPTNTFDDVDDYHGLDEQPVDALGNSRSAYGGYRVQVAVSYAGTAVSLATDSRAKQISITVTPPGQAPLPFSVYRGNY